MSYESVKLAQTPLLYYRLDQSGAGVDNEPVTDIGTAGLDATLHFVGTIQPPWGLPSPIETDPASREFWGYVNASIYGFGLNDHSYITLASDALMQPSPKDFTVGGWIRVMDNIPFAGTFGLVSKQSTGGILMRFNGGTRLGGFCFDSNGSLFVVDDPSFLVTDHIGESFYIVVVRSGDALALYVNGSLRNITTVTSGLPTQFTSDPFYIHPGGSFYLNFRVDEVEYHTRALSPSEITASYEAALLDLLMHGECAIVTSARIIGSTQPDPIAYPFRHNWSERVIERLSWKSSVQKPVNGATELAMQRLAPRRTIEYQHLLMNERLRRQYEARAFGGRTSIVQFEPDKVNVGALSAGSTSATFDTTLKDFEVGPAYVWQDDETYELVNLTAVDASGVEWEDPLEGEYTNAWLKPARKARLETQLEMEQVTDTVGDASTIYVLDEADEPLSPRRITPFSVTTTYRGRELWDLREWQGHNYVEPPKWEWAPVRAELDNGTGSVSTKQQRWGAETLQPWNMLLDGREAIAKYLGWLYERRGQYSPFWMPTFKQDLKPLARQGVQLLVEGNEYSNLYAAADNRVDLAFVYWDNTYICRRIEDLAATDDGDQLFLDAAVPTFTNLRYLCFLRRVILSSDELELAWETDDKMQVAFAVVDAPLDWAAGSPSVSPSPSPSGSPSVSPSHSASPSVSPSQSLSPSFSTSPSASGSPSVSPSLSQSPSASASPSRSASPSTSPSGSTSPSASVSPSSSASASPSASPSITPSPSHSVSPSSSNSPSVSPSGSQSPSSSASPSSANLDDPPGVSPSDLSGLELWLKANNDQFDSTADGTQISSDWQDSSTNNRDATPVASGPGTVFPKFKLAQLNGYPAIRLVNAGDTNGGWFTLPDFLTGFTAGEVFCVIILDNDPVSHNASHAAANWGPATDDSYYPFSGDGKIYDKWGTTARKDVITYTGALTSWHLYNVRTASGAWSNYKNGTQLSTTGTNTVGWGTSPMIGRNVQNSKTLQGLVAEVIFYSRVLTSSERFDTIHTYLNNKYNLGLPTS